MVGRATCSPQESVAVSACESERARALALAQCCCIDRAARMPIGLTDSGTCRSVQVRRGQVTTRSRRGQARSRQVGNSARFRGHDGARSAEPGKRRGRYRELAWPLNAHVPEAGVGQGPGLHCISMLPLNAHVGKAFYNHQPLKTVPRIATLTTKSDTPGGGKHCSLDKTVTTK